MTASDRILASFVPTLAPKLVWVCWVGSVLAVVGVVSAETNPPPARPTQRLLVNNDGTNLLWRDDLTPEMVRNHVAECPNAVTTYLLCPNGIQKMLYPSAHEELASRGAIPRLVASGQDPFGQFIAGLKQRGLETFITWRMNEVHNVNLPKEPDLSRFWRDHPEYRVERGANPNNWMAQCLDYALPQVRDYNFNLIAELIGKYAPDGIELDWMRFPRHLSGQGDDIWNQRQHLTDFVARVRAKADDLARRRGRPLLVAVRVPTSPAGCRALGVDLVEWHQRHLIDFVTAAPFLSTDFAMPLRELRQWLGANPVPIYGGIEFGYSGRAHSESTLRAAALGLWDSGADGLYLFNFPCWREQQPHPCWSWVPPLLNRRVEPGTDLRFPLIDNRHRVAGIDLPTPLPVTLPPGQSQAVTVRLPKAAVDPVMSPRLVRLTWEGATNVTARIGAATVAADGTVPTQSVQPGDNPIVFSNPGNTPATVALAELTLAYPAASPTPYPVPEPEPAHRFHVAPEGSDAEPAASATASASAPDPSARPGTETRPFRTLARARDAARALRAAQPGVRIPVTILLHAGRHSLDTPLLLDARDSDTTFQAAAGEPPILSGGRAVTGWKPDSKGRWTTTVGLDPFRQLYVNDRRAVRARGLCPPDLPRFGDPSKPDADAGFLFPDADMATWRNPTDIELGFFNSWSHMICGVRTLARDSQGRTAVHLRQPEFHFAAFKEGVQAQSPAYIENALELLDTPGEWYYDRPTRTLYYQPRPDENPATARVIAPQLETLLRIDGTLERPARNIAFTGIVFAEATWLEPNRTGHPDVQANFTATVTNTFQRDGWRVAHHNEYRKSAAHLVLRAAVDCRLDRCTFTRLGGAGIDLEQGARGNRIDHSHFFDISASAIQIGDVQATDHHPADPRQIVRDNHVTHCTIHDIGLEYQDSVGIFAGYTDGTVIAHNEIHHLPYSAVAVGWGWGEEDAGGGAYEVIPFRYPTPTPAGANRIEYNHIHNVMQHRDDGGAIYTLGNQPGSIIRANHIHDCGPGRPGGIYLDEGSGFIEIVGNAVYRVATPMNYNNRAQNRIATCFEHNNAFAVLPETPGFPAATARAAGPDRTTP
jgi:hypothetical protein